MRVGIIIPTRGDRPRFLKNCLRQIESQTLRPVSIALMDYEPELTSKDITQRYRKGYDQLRGKKLDIISLWEDDDFYAPDYLKTMVDQWEANGRPDLLGTSYTWYYNIGAFAYFKMEHHTQSHAMSTLIKPDLTFPWAPDNEAFTDVWLWNLHSHLKGAVFTPNHTICMGMKHNVGLTGGNSHAYTDPKYINKDADLSWLESNLTPESFEFFSMYF